MKKVELSSWIKNTVTTIVKGVNKNNKRSKYSSFKEGVENEIRMYKLAAKVTAGEELIGIALNEGLEYVDKLQNDYLIQCMSLDESLTLIKNSAKILIEIILKLEYYFSVSTNHYLPLRNKVPLQTKLRRPLNL